MPGMKPHVSTPGCCVTVTTTELGQLKRQYSIQLVLYYSYTLGVTMRPTYLFTAFLAVQGLTLIVAYLFHPTATFALEAGLISLATAVPMRWMEKYGAREAAFKE